jgi:Tol biopolymer transport system component
MPASEPLRFARAALVLLCAVVVCATVAACGATSGGKSDPATSPTFLLASFTTLSELNLETGASIIVRAGAGAFVRYPSLSPDGKQVAFSRQEAARTRPDGVVDFGADIYIVPREGGEPRLVVQHATPGQFLGSPLWLADGNTLLFSVRGLGVDGQPDLHIAAINLSTGERRVIIEDAAEPSLSRDHQELVFVSFRNSLTASDIAISNVDGSNFRLVLNGSAGLSAILSPVMSPDGKRIAFAGMREEAVLRGVASSGSAHPSTHDVWIVNRDGSGLATYADIADINPSLSWSAEGRLYVLGSGGIWRIAAAETAPVKLSAGLANSQFELISD